MEIPKKTWSRFTKTLRAISKKAGGLFTEYLETHDISTPEGMQRALEYAYGLSVEYGEGTAALACEMHEAVAQASGKRIQPAEPAEMPTFREVSMAVRGKMMDSKRPDVIGTSVERLVKRTGVDTSINNALRDGAEFAWIPSGDSCAFCLMLASNGWQRASKKAIKNGHAVHVHANCDCTYAIRFDGHSTVEGYDPDSLYDEYMSAKGDNWKEKMNSMRRAQYAVNKDAINEQKRAAYAKRENNRQSITVKDAYNDEFDRFIRDTKLTEAELKQTQIADTVVADYLQKEFPGYMPAKLTNGPNSESVVTFNPVGGYSYKVERHICNVAMSAGDGNVEIGNNALANSIHERTHDLINCLAMKRAEITDDSTISIYQMNRFNYEKRQIILNAFVDCFSNETTEEIYDKIEKELGKRAKAYGEMIPEGVVSWIGIGKSVLADRIYNYLRKEWKKS